MAQIKLLQPPGNGLTPGAAATVSIATGQETAVAAVPAQALLRDAEGNYSVFLAAEGKAVSHQVTLGEVMGELVEITTALPLESKVIISNVDHLKNGDSIASAE
ncbi:MAG TPA: hypothetical protein DCP36_13170 [Sporomusaceae bacterium]|nr:hypothetical protein [Sporomusaceae bacterium]